VAALEKAIKGVLFDCRMCGQCVLGATGMSCPMKLSEESPKRTMRRRAGGRLLRVRPEMKCVWLEAVEGSTRIRGGDAALKSVQPALDRRLRGRSSWLRVAQEIGGRQREP